VDRTWRARAHAQVNEQGSLFVTADAAPLAPGKASRKAPLVVLLNEESGNRTDMIPFGGHGSDWRKSKRRPQAPPVR
jgi:hypothetical protein